MNEYAINVKNLSKIYHLYDSPILRLKESLSLYRKRYHRDFYALKNINLSINKNETVGIIGRNGSGKSTLLKLITGVLSPSSGSIDVSGRISALLELGAGFNPELSGLENVNLNGMIMGFSKNEIANKMDAILDFADIGQFIHQPVKTYSSGMFARLAFAVAVNTEPEILIVDEALSVGDIRFQQKCLRKMSEFAMKGTVVIVSHDLVTLNQFCDRLIWINDGEVFRIGSKEDILKEYHAFMNYGMIPTNCKTSTAFEDKNNNANNDKLITDLSDNVLSDNVLSDNVLSDNVLSDNATSKLYSSLDIIESTFESFGSKDAIINAAGLFDQDGNKISVIETGQNITMIQKVQAYKKIVNPIPGFVVKDKTGVPIIATNSIFEEKSFSPLNADESVYYTWSFRMPFVKSGTYVVDLAIADGTYENHVQCHWINEVFVVDVVTNCIYPGSRGTIIPQNVLLQETRR